MQTKTIGRMPTDHGPYVPGQAYGKKFQVELYGCVWESKHDNNNTAPATLNAQAGTITPNTTDWKKVTGSTDQWLIDNGYKNTPASHVTDSNQNNKTQQQINTEVKTEIGTDSTPGSVKGRIKSLENSVGSGGSVDSRIANAVGAESTRAQAAESNLQQLYEALTQSDIEVVNAVPASGVANKIYRVVGETKYSDYMFNRSDLNTPVKMAEYDNAIDDEPTAGSNNLVRSEGVYDEIYGKTYTKKDLPNGGFVQYTTGAYEPAQGYYYTSDFIQVTEGQYIEVTDFASGSVAVISAYSSNTESSYVQSASISGSDGAVSKVKYIVPVGVNYIRFSCSHEGLESFLASIATENASGNLTIKEIKLEGDEKSLSKVSDTIQVGWFYGFIRPTGEIEPGGMSYRYTDYIPVSGGQIFDIPSYGNSSSTTTATFYESRNQSSIITDFNIYPPSDWSAVRKKISVPFGVSYMRICCANDATIELFVRKLGDISVELPKVSTLSYTAFKNENNIELLNVGNLRQGKAILSSSPYNIVDYTANRIILTDYIDVKGLSWINYSGIPCNGEMMLARFSKTKDDNAPATDVRVLSLNQSVGTNSGSLFIGLFSEEYRYMTCTVCRVNPDVAVSLWNVSLEGVINNSYSQELFRYRGIAPKRPCLAIQMDLNSVSINAQTTYDFVNLCKNIGFAPTFFPMDSDAGNPNLKKWIDEGCEVGIHTRPADGIGQTNPEPHPNESQFRNIVNNYIWNFVGNGINPIGWVTSQGLMVQNLVPYLTDYVGYAHTLVNGGTGWGTPTDYVNNQQTDRFKIKRWVLEQMNDGSDNITEADVIADAKTLINNVVNTGGMAILYTHSYNQYDGTTYTLRENVFKEVLAHVYNWMRQGRLVVGTTAEICNYYFG